MKRAFAMAALVASVVMAPVAHADDEQGYLDELTQNGVPMGNGAVGALRGGREVCDNLHHGMSAEQVVSTQFGPFGFGAWGPMIVAAAQHHLCPDTLAPGG